MQLSAGGQGAVVHVHEVEADRGQLGPEAADGGCVAAPTEHLQSGLWIVVLDDFGPGATPVDSAADPQVGIGFEVAYIAGVAALLGDDPTGVAVDVHPDHGAAPLTAASALRLDQYVARQESGPDHQLRWRVEDVSLQQPNSLALPVAEIIAHSNSLPQESTHRAGPVSGAVLLFDLEAA